MSRVLLTTESGADIPPELAARHHIHTVPMHVSFGGESREDGTFPSDEICGYYRRTGVLPRTSGSTPEDFSRVFDRLHAQYPEGQILHLAYSAVTTCSFQSARLAAEGRDYVTIVDTKMASAGQGAVVLRTARLLEEHPEWDAARTAAAAEELSRRCRMCFIPGSLEFLRAGGRVSNATALCGRLLSMALRLEISEDAFRGIRRRLRLVDAFSPAYRYSRLGVLCALLHIPFRRRRRYFCSQFVAELLSASGAMALPHPAGFYLPERLRRELLHAPNLAAVEKGVV